jgi:single-strand DNA-binding protein
MAGEIPISIVGNLVRDPEIRFTPSGASVANFTVASTPRKFDKNSNSWQDGEPTFMPCNAWRTMAENVAESLKQGDRVIVVGTMVTRSWEDRESGQKRSRQEINVESVGPDLKFRMATVNRVDRQQGGQQQSHRADAPPADPWDQPPPQQSQRSGQQQFPDDPPPF